MTGQEEFEKWAKSQNINQYNIKVYARKSWQACAEQKNAIIAEYEVTLKTYEGLVKRSIELAKNNEQQAKEIERLRNVLSEYANVYNWHGDHQGIRRLWLEPGSSTPEAYNGFEMARAAILSDKNGNQTKLLTGEKE